MSAIRSVARAAAKQALRRSPAAAAGVSTATRHAALASSRRSASASLSPATVAQTRMCSSSRFLSLADDEEKRERDADDDGEDGEDDGEEDGEDGEGDEGRELQDGELKLEEEADINDGGVDIDDERDDEIMALFMENPARWTTEKLARKFFLSKPRVEAIIYLKSEEAELTLDEFRAQVRVAKEAAQARMDEEAAALARAQAAGDEKEVRRLEKRARQAAEEEETGEELSAEDEALLHGVDDDAYRNPDFFFLSDEFEGFPPLVRRLGKHASTDKMYPEEAVALQKLAVNNVVTPLKSFAKPAAAKAKWKIAVKDISKKKKALYMRDAEQPLRLATDAETLPRTWVRRPAFFDGLKI